jgi:hypothetical protein
LSVGIGEVGEKVVERRANFAHQVRRKIGPHGGGDGFGTTRIIVNQHIRRVVQSFGSRRDLAAEVFASK